MSTATAASDEQWEGVLVQVTGDVSSESLGYGEWGVDDTSGECRIDDRGYDAIGTGNVTAGSTWQVTGPLDYSFGNYKIQPVRSRCLVVRLHQCRCFELQRGRWH